MHCMSAIKVKLGSTGQGNKITIVSQEEMEN